MKVIITRPAPDALDFAEEVRAAGAEPVLSPGMTIECVDRALPALDGRPLAFTSTNGVRAFARLSADRASEVFAVGATTAAAAKDAGFARVHTAEGEVESLAALIARSKPASEILHFAGADIAGDLVALLAARGVAARRETIYAARPIGRLSAAARQILTENAPDCAVALFSPRSARLFLEALAAEGLSDKRPKLRALCLSAAVATAAGGGWAETLIAEDRTSAGIARLIRERVDHDRVISSRRPGDL